MKNVMETPDILSTSYAGTINEFANTCIPNTTNIWENKVPDYSRDILNMIDKMNTEDTEEQGEEMSNRRLVKVIIVDPNENVPVEKAVLFNEGEKVTDLEDNEIFFDMDIKTMLKEHNDYRITVLDKQASKNKDKDVFLDPVRIKDLKMVVLEIAKF